MQIKHATWDTTWHARILQAEAEIAHILCESMRTSSCEDERQSNNQSKHNRR